jgi:hypothetical protein
MIYRVIVFAGLTAEPHATRVRAPAPFRAESFLPCGHRPSDRKRHEAHAKPGRSPSPGRSILPTNDRATCNNSTQARTSSPLHRLSRAVKPKPFLYARLRLPVQDFIHGLIAAPWPHAGEAEIHSRSTFDTRRSTFAEMPRLFFVAVLAFTTFAILSGCASTTTTTVGVTTNEAPRFHEVGR